LKVCAFGTTRLDFHIYKPSFFEQHEEVKVDNLDTKIGGSVFNTAVLLKYLNLDIVFYTILGNDELSVISKNALRNYGIDYKCTSSKGSKSPVTFILLDSDGEKVMFSYDGNSYTDDVIDILQKNCNMYDAFFTSCYEINNENRIKVSNILQDFVVRNKKTFIDLSPLTYRVSKEVWNDVLPYTKIVTGTENEFKALIEILGHSCIEDFKKKYSIEKLFIKKGSKGCTVIDQTNQYDFRVTPIKSKNLTGCGDAFNAGVIIGELKHFPVEKTVKIASKLASEVAKNGFEPLGVVEPVLADVR